MITIHSINLKQVNDQCFASIGNGSISGCRSLVQIHEGCGTYKCPFYKPKACSDWIRIEDNTGVNLIPPEEYRRKK